MRLPVRFWITPAVLLCPTILLGAVALWNVARENELRQERLNALMGIAQVKGNLPAKGSRAPDLIVADPQGKLANLSKCGQWSIVVSVGNCGSCSERVIEAYDSLWHQGYPVSIVSASPPDEIAEARRGPGWRAPIYSETRFPTGVSAWRTPWRPWACVIREGQIAYSQQPDHAWYEAVDRIRVLVRPSLASR